MNILVTGGLGFIGTNLVESLLENPEVSFVYVLDKITYASNNKLWELTKKEDTCDKLTIHQFDILNINELYSTMDFDFCIHLAAESNVDKSMDALEHFVNINGYGSYEVAKYCFKHGIKLIHFSTDEVYGELPLNIDKHMRFNEKRTVPQPRNPYAVSKYIGEQMVRLAQTELDKPNDCIILRPCNQFGPYQDDSKFIPRMFDCVAESKRMPIYGDGINIREWMYVKDTCNIVNRIISKWNKNYSFPSIMNLGSGNDMSNMEIAKWITEHFYLDLAKKIEFVEDPRGNCHDTRYAVDNYEMKTNLGGIKLTNFNMAMQETMDWMVCNFVFGKMEEYESNRYS